MSFLDILQSIVPGIGSAAGSAANGLGDTLSAGVHPGDVPMAPQHAPGGTPAATPVADLLGQYMNAEPDKPSGLQRFGSVLGLLGSGISQAVGDDPQAVSRFSAAQQSQNDSAQSAAQRQQLFKMAQSLNLPPIQQLLFATDPEKWAETYGKRVNEYHAQAGGTTGYWGDPTLGGSQASAPMYGQENGEGYSATPDHMTDLGGLAQSPNQAADLAMRQALEAERQRHEQEMERIAAQNAQSNRIKADKYNTGKGKGGGSVLPPGVSIGGW